MKITSSALLALAMSFFVSQAVADLQPWKDYDLGSTVMSVTTVKVDVNQMDAYLEGLKQTWVASNEVAKQLGQIKDYRILSSDLPGSGEFNLILIVTFDSMADLAPSKQRYEAFMKKWGEAHEQQNKEISQKYPDLRTITGEYLMRDITIK